MSCSCFVSSSSVLHCQAEKLGAAKRQAERRIRLAERAKGTTVAADADERSRREAATRSAKRIAKERAEAAAMESMVVAQVISGPDLSPAAYQHPQISAGSNPSLLLI
jgi:hypothetical protein